MDSRYLGRSGLHVSRLALGTMTWGRDTDADAAAAQLEAFVEAGGTLIDTAIVHGDGEAESILGTLVPDVVPRSSVVLSTTTVGVGGGRGRLLCALDARWAGSVPITSTSGRCTASTLRCRSRRPAWRCRWRSLPAAAATSGCRA